jgi:hypothetical protein
MTQDALVDLGAALAEISDTAAGKALLTLLERLEADVALQALDGDPADLPRYQGQREALKTLRYQLAAIPAAAQSLAQDEVAEGSRGAGELARFSGASPEDDVEPEIAEFTRPGGADFGAGEWRPPAD